jgi:AraC-like DNA-binding protein
VTEPSWLTRVVLLHLEHTTRLGLPREDLLRQARLDERHLRDPDGRVPVSVVIRLWRAIAERATEPTIGLLLGKHMRVKEFGLVGYAMAHSRTLGAALKRLDRYDRIVSETLNVALDTTAGATWVRMDVQSPLRALRPAADARLAALVSVCRELTAASLDLLAVRLPYREPEQIVEYQQFFRAPLEFGALATAFLLRTRDLERPVAQGDETLAGYLDRLAEQLLPPLERDATARDQIRNALWSALPDGVPELASLARGLGVSGRTLQRRLRDEGTTYREVLADFRRDAAPALLREGRLGVSEVAFVLGYEDPASFQRAFRHTFGMPPRAFRGRLAAA